MLRDWNLYHRSFDELLGELDERILKGKKTFIVTANPVIFMEGQKDSAYRAMVSQADYITPDGIGIVKASKWLGMPVRDRITGFDLMTQLLGLGERRRLKVFLLGSSAEVVARAGRNITEQFPGIEIAGVHHGYLDFCEDDVVREIQAAEPDLIFVAMGCPKQERWISEHLGDFRKGVFIGVGGSIDVFAGLEARAPQAWIRLNLEWLYRIVRKPRRVLVLGKLIPFAVEVLKELASVQAAADKAGRKIEG